VDDVQQEGSKRSLVEEACSFCRQDPGERIHGSSVRLRQEEVYLAPLSALPPTKVSLFSSFVKAADERTISHITSHILLALSVLN
jgi:hypothetical protein